MRILFLLADVFSYNFAVLDILQNKYNHDIHLIHWARSKGSENHKIFYNPTYNIYNKPKYYKELDYLTSNINPEIIIIAGWMDYFYLKIAFKYRKLGCKVICAMDTQYDNTIKQNIASKILNFNFLRKLFYTHAWIPGYPQFETALKLGFNKNEIIFALLSADTNIFRNFDMNQNSKKTFLFVGRLEEAKGVDILLDVWSKLAKIYPDWSLKIIGDGKFKNLFSNVNNIQYKGFLNPQDVAFEMNNSDCFVLPSNYEPWALVIHEAALCGLPIICTNKCGASTIFVIDQLNGYIVKENDPIALYEAMDNFINLSKDQVIQFSKYSLQLASQISSHISAAHLHSNI
jgi:glycosyltransferase involved in cell wall biosynthesis